MEDEEIKKEEAKPEEKPDKPEQAKPEPKPEPVPEQPDSSELNSLKAELSRMQNRESCCPRSCQNGSRFPSD